MHAHCDVFSTQTGETAASFEVERRINCFTFIQVYYVLVINCLYYNDTVIAMQDDVLAIGSEHSCICLYSTTTGALLARLEGHTNRLEKFCGGFGGRQGGGGNEQCAEYDFGTIIVLPKHGNIHSTHVSPTIIARLSVLSLYCHAE